MTNNYGSSVKKNYEGELLYEKVRKEGVGRNFVIGNGP